jgi:hypothetical protein
MASPNATFTEMVTTTLRNHPSEVADNVSGHNALYRRLKDKGQIKMVSEGYEIVRNLDYAENATFQRYSGYDTLNIAASDVLSAAKYDWVQSAVHITASGRELRQNSGKAAMVDLVKARTKNAKRTAANNMSIDLYSSGSLSNQMGGLGHIVTSDGTGTVGGINSSTFSFWQNNFFEATATPSASNTKGFMQSMWLELNRGGDRPDLIVASHDMYGFFWDSLTDLQRYASSDKAVAGFNSLKFVDADVVFDSNSNFGTTAKVMYFLNTDFLELVVHREANWSSLDEKTSVNQDAVVIPLIWMGNLTCSNRSLQGKLIDEA